MPRYALTSLGSLPAAPPPRRRVRSHSASLRRSLAGLAQACGTVKGTRRGKGGGGGRGTGTGASTAHEGACHWATMGRPCLLALSLARACSSRACWPSSRADAILSTHLLHVQKAVAIRIVPLHHAPRARVVAARPRSGDHSTAFGVGGRAPTRCRHHRQRVRQLAHVDVATAVRIKLGAGRRACACHMRDAHARWSEGQVLGPPRASHVDAMCAVGVCARAFGRVWASSDLTWRKTLAVSLATFCSIDRRAALASSIALAVMVLATCRAFSKCTASASRAARSASAFARAAFTESCAFKAAARSTCRCARPVLVAPDSFTATALSRSSYLSRVASSMYRDLPAAASPPAAPN